MSTTMTYNVASEVHALPSHGAADEAKRSIPTIDELIKRRAVELNEAPLVGYPRQGIVDFEEHSARAIDRYADAAVVILQHLGLNAVVCHDYPLIVPIPVMKGLYTEEPAMQKPPVIGILAQSGLNVVITIIALSRLGYTVFLVSTRLASPALAQLLELSDCNTLLTTENFYPILTEVRKERPLLEWKSLLVHSDYYGVDAPIFYRSYDPNKETKKTAVIIHSSGSTGLPKPIFLTHENCIATFAANLNMRALIASPLFHSHGFYETFRSIYSGKPIFLANYAFPLTRQSLMDMVDAVKPELFHVVPYMVKLIAESDLGVMCLTRVRLVLFGGSACPDDLGDRLVAQGVNLVANYGSTEIGRVMNSNRHPGDLAWNYVRMLPAAKSHVLMDEISPGLFECVGLDGLKAKCATNSDDPPNSFRTRDLFTPHPTRKGLWKYVCRLDDRCTLINGEKVLPVPIEGRIRQDELVREACVFGESRSLPGVLIIKADSASRIPDGEYLDLVWPAVEAANARAEKFSRVPKELVVILPADTNYPKTDKGTFIRTPMYRQFQTQINAAYDEFQNKQEGGNICLSGSKMEDFLISKMNEQLGIQMKSPQQDFFSSGIDSLQCIQMWSLLKRELDLGGRQAELSQNVMYEMGNVKNLSRHLTELRTGVKNVVDEELEKMEELISCYSSFKPHVGGRCPAPQKDTVLLTGATGSLGAHVLAQLVARPSVAAVWTMVRASDDDAADERIRKSLKTRSLELRQGQMEKVVPVACDLSRPDLGLDPERLSQLLTNLTCCIHSAWAVNFNIAVQSFEDQHIKATHNLIQLCLSVPTPEPACFFFYSSVSAAAGSPRPGTVLERPVSSPSHAQKTGYARSKYVTEHITRNANKQVKAPAQILRVGQLVGDSREGRWNTSEGIPLMIQTAVTLGALPALDEEMTWLPVDYAAAVVLDLAKIPSEVDITRKGDRRITCDPDLVYHVLNPHRFHWTREMIPALARAGLQFELLPTSQWMNRLRQSEKNPVKNPPIKLLNWFEGKYGSAASSKKTETLEYLTDETLKASPTLGALPKVTDEKFVKCMIGNFREQWNGA